MEQMEIQKYGVTDLTRLVTLTNNNTLPTTIIPQHHQQALLFGNQQHHYADNNAMMMQTVPTYHDQVCAAATNSLSTGIESGYDRVGCDNVSVSASGSARWPRHETLTLLEIRSRLDFKFKEATQKGHLWDELSRIMYEEHGYQRSGKKCREKFENLYKYYKKTREGKSGRRNGKHYRFFLQLEALYGSEANNKRGPSNDNNLISLSNSSRYETSDSDNDSIEKSRKRAKGGSKRDDKWEVNVKDFIDSQMSKIMEKQEIWFDKMMRSIEDKEQERFFREEKWRKQEIERIEKENTFWANERSWIEARDGALIEALHKLKTKGINEDELVMNKIRSSGYDNQNFNCDGRGLSLHNHQGGQLGPKLSLVQPNNNNNDGSSSSHSKLTVGNNSIMQESCFRLFMGNSEHLNPWDNYG